MEIGFQGKIEKHIVARLGLRGIRMECSCHLIWPTFSLPKGFHLIVTLQNSFSLCDSSKSFKTFATLFFLPLIENSKIPLITRQVSLKTVSHSR